MSDITKEIKCLRCLKSDVRRVEGHRTVCLPCSADLRRVFQFCWACEREWPKNRLGPTCQLKDCEKLAALLSKEVITDRCSSARGCPFFRACPTCSALLTHNGEGCPRIVCPNCRSPFCFRCLQRSCLGFRGQCCIVVNRLSVHNTQ